MIVSCFRITLIEQEKTFVMVQYLMYFEESEFQDGPSTLHTELYMEKETAFFYIQRSTESRKRRTSSQLTISSNISTHQSTNQLHDKNFFIELKRYIHSVDKFLSGNITAYHSIVKNSILQQININTANQLIKHEICFFKQINHGQTRSRQKNTLEMAIKQKMQLLRRDWKDFLESRYKELYKVEVQERNGETGDEEEESGGLHIENLLENSKLIKEEEF